MALSLPGHTTPTEVRANVRPVQVKTPKIRALLHHKRPHHDEASATTVIDGTDLRNKRPDLTTAIAAASGAQVTRTGGFGQGATVRIRASRPEQVTWALQDVPLRTADGAPFDPEDLPVIALSGAEIYRGASPSALGGQAMGGAVRLTLRRPNEPGVEARAAAGSYGAQLVEAFGAWRSAGEGSVAVRYMSADGDYPYRHDGGTWLDTGDDTTRNRTNNGVRRASAIALHRIALGRWRLEARYLGSWRHQGLAGLALYEAREAAVDTLAHDATLAARGKGIFTAGDVLRVTAHAGRRHTAIEDSAGELGIAQRLAQDVDGVAGFVRWRSPPIGGGRLELRTGADAGRVRGGEQLAGSTRPDASLRRLEAGATWRQRFARVLVVGNISGATVAAERFNLAPESGVWAPVPASRWAPISGRLSARVGVLEGLTATVGGQHAARVPNLSELYGNDGTVVGNPLLGAEASTGVFAGAAWRSAIATKGLSATAGVETYASRSTDLIALVRTSPVRAVYRNVQTADVIGIETRAGLAWGRWLALTGGWTMTRARDRSGLLAYRDKPLPMVPLSRWTVRCDAATEPALRLLSRVGAFVADTWQAGHFADRAGIVPIPARNTLNFGVWAAERLERFRFAVRVDNALNAARFDLIGFPLPGRTVMATVTASSWGAAR